MAEASTQNPMNKLNEAHYLFSLFTSVRIIPQVFLFTCVSTCLGFMQPAFNAFFLMTLGVPSVVMMVYNLKKEESPRVNSLGKRSIGTNNSENW